MATNDTGCTIAPYFKAKAGQLDAFKQICAQFVAKAQTESGCLYYGFAFDGDSAHCREGYKDADSALAHLKNVASLLEEAAKVADLVRLEIHGPEGELAKLRGPLAGLKPQFFTLEMGFRH